MPNPDCEIEALVNYQRGPVNLPSDMNLTEELFKDGDMTFRMPFYAPWPFCGKSFLDVNYELREDARKLDKWNHAWLTYDTDERELRLSS